REFFQLAEHLRGIAINHQFVVQPALLEFQQPDIAGGWRRLLDQQIDRVVVAPLLLFLAGHAKHDIPQEVAEVAGTMPFVFSRPLSRHADLVELVCDRIREGMAAGCESGNKNAAPGDAANTPQHDDTMVVVIGRGNRDVCAHADLRVLTKLVGHRLQQRHAIAGCTYAFYAMATPDVPTVLDDVAAQARRRGLRRVFVHPHLLFNGRLYAAIQRLVDEAQRRNDDIVFTLGDYLGPVLPVASAIWGRCVAACDSFEAAIMTEASGANAMR
ncbi:MAG: CbiX/SirB N-terminal domain-containing protein, partial [Planctomycetota bacterium]